MGREGHGALPLIPPLRDEVKALVRRQMESDEQTVFPQMPRLGSMSAGLKVELWLTGEILREPSAA